MLRAIFCETPEYILSIYASGILLTHKVNEVVDAEPPLVLLVRVLCLHQHAPEGGVFRPVK